METTTPNLKLAPTAPTNPTEKPTEAEWSADDRITGAGPQFDEWDSSLFDIEIEDANPLREFVALMAVTVATFLTACVVLGFGIRLAYWAAGF